MKAAVLFAAPGELEVVDVDIDEPRGREVLVRTAAAGLCHSDLHVMRGAITRAVPSVLGHESAGIVEAVGPDVTTVAVGDRVVCCLSVFCGTCRRCLAGDTWLCDDKAATGRRPGEPARLLAGGEPIHAFSHIGGLAELLLVHENATVRVPRELPLDRAALLGCGVLTGLGAVLNAARVRPGDTTVVVGCGGIGLNAVQGCALAGASRVVAVDRVPSKLALARTLGATDVVDASAGDPVEAVRDLTGGGADHAFEAVGLLATIDQALKMTGRGGQTTLIGMVEAHELTEIATMPMVVEERVIAASWYGTFVPQRDWPRIVGWLESGDLMLDQMIERIRLEDINLAFDRIRTSEAARQVVVFDGA